MDVSRYRFRGLAHISVHTRDIEESIRFYLDNLAFELVYRTVQKPDCVPDSFYPLQFALIRQGTCLVELVAPSDPARVASHQRGVIDHFALEVKGIDEICEQLCAKGINFELGITEMHDLFDGFRCAFIKGPSGEAIELFQFL